MFLFSISMFYFNCAFLFSVESFFFFLFNLEIIDVTLCVAWYFVKKICFFKKRVFFFWCLMIIMMMMIMMTVPTILIGERKRLTVFDNKSKPSSRSHKQSSFHFPLYFLKQNAEFCSIIFIKQTTMFSTSQTYFFINVNWLFPN